MPRVYVIFRNQLFGDAIRAVLRAHHDIELVGATTEPDQVVTDVAALTPDVILLEETEGSPAMTDLYVLLFSPIPCRLITLRLDEDGMHVWSQTWRRTVQTQDLVQAIMTADSTGAHAGQNQAGETSRADGQLPVVVSSQ